MPGARVADLVRAFEEIARTRMAGLPMVNPALRVEAVGFDTATDDEGQADGLVGILVTPWFMNLVWLPAPGAHAQATGACRTRRVGREAFEFIGGDTAGVGRYEACSLFSPMFEFADQAGAIATANAVLEALRKPPVQAPPSVPARRAFLFGRTAARGAP